VKKVFSALLCVSFGLCLKAQVSLGPNVSTFGVLGASTVTNSGATTIIGNLGLSPGSSITGFPPGTVSGSINIANSLAGAAQNDLTTAYTTAANLPSNGANPPDLGGTTVFPGVYSSSSGLQLTGTVTLNGNGNANSVFVFQIGSTLITASNSAVVLITVRRQAMSIGRSEVQRRLEPEPVLLEISSLRHPFRSAPEPPCSAAHWRERARLPFWATGSLFHRRL
jgi:hypothetical protein